MRKDPSDISASKESAHSAGAPWKHGDRERDEISWRRGRHDAFEMAGQTEFDKIWARKLALANQERHSFLHKTLTRRVGGLLDQ